MDISTPSKSLRKDRTRIASEVRSLRQARHWTQAELAGRLQLSQSRLSEIERGAGSFTAEQFLLILKLFNVAPSHFVAESPTRDSQIQNALASLGATHLRESDEILPSEELQDPRAAVRETIIEGSPRLLAALAPVLVRNVDRVSVHRLYLELLSTGLERRLLWLVENTLDAIRSELADTPPRNMARLFHRADVVLRAFIEPIIAAQPALAPYPKSPDILDTTIRSKQTLDEITAASSSISRKWGIVTALQPEDFANALRAARADR